MVAAVFFGIYQAYDSNGQNIEYIIFILSIIGLILSFAWFLINKGSRFWQENWESHIDMLEDEFDGKLYKTVNESNLMLNGFSVSKVNSTLSIMCFSLFFVIILENIVQEKLMFTDILLIFFVLCLFLALITIFFRTKKQEKHTLNYKFKTREYKKGNDF